MGDLFGAIEGAEGIVVVGLVVWGVYVLNQSGFLTRFLVFFTRLAGQRKVLDRE